MKNNSKISKKLTAKTKGIYSLLMIVLTFVVGLSIAEILIRVFIPQQETMRWFLPDEKYGHVLKRNFHQRYHYFDSNFFMDVKTNSLGLRDKEYDLSRTDVKRILLLGDSFVFGHGVNIEDCFDSRLEELLNRSGESFFVINAGVGGWGSLQEFAYAKDNFALFNPDIIVVTFCGNDLGDDLRFIAKVPYRRGLLRFPGKVFVRNHSHLYRLIQTKFSRLRHNWKVKKKHTDVKKRLTDIEGIIDKQSGCIITEDDFDRTLGYIKSFHYDFLKFNPDGLLLVQSTNPLNANIRSHLSSLSNGEDLIYVDLYDDVSQLRPEQMKVPHFGHWSPLMHSISAENLFKNILNYYFSNSN
ncbi:MAG: SGNH/GDSL hydrolase family protein [Candidatus Hodarchaeota archaeon]